MTKKPLWYSSRINLDGRATKDPIIYRHVFSFFCHVTLAFSKLLSLSLCSFFISEPCRKHASKSVWNDSAVTEEHSEIETR